METSITFPLLAVLLAAHPSTACDTPTACLAEIERAQAGTRSLAATFTQTKYISLLDEPLVSSGRFIFAPPSRVTWSVEKPEPFEVKIDGERIDIPGMSESDRRSMAMTPIAGMFRQLGAIFTGALGKLQEGFDVTTNDGAEVLGVTLQPKHEQWRKIFQRIELRFARPRLVLARMEIHEPLGDRLVVELTNVERTDGAR